MVVEKITEEAAAWRWQVLGACAFCPWGLLVVSPIAGTETGLRKCAPLQPQNSALWRQR
jgi:hypothetical protein